MLLGQSLRTHELRFAVTVHNLQIRMTWIIKANCSFRGTLDVSRLLVEHGSSSCVILLLLLVSHLIYFIYLIGIADRVVIINSILIIFFSFLIDVIIDTIGRVKFIVRIPENHLIVSFLLFCKRLARMHKTQEDYLLFFLLLSVVYS